MASGWTAAGEGRVREVVADAPGWLGPGAGLRGRPFLTGPEFRRLRDFIYERSGLFFTDARRPLLEGRVQRRLRALRVASPGEYLERLDGPDGAAGELLELLDAVATHETSFFRDRAQLDGFRSRVLPAVLSAVGDRRELRVWSAACSSGEEPYSLAMILLESLGADAPRWDVRVTGTDLSRSMIAKAGIGEYGPYSFRSAPAYYVQKYFEAPAPDVFRVRAEVRRLVHFRLLNFADVPAMRAMRGYHIVFCRNALIYFDGEAKRRCVEHLAEALEPGGYLFVGPCESLQGVSETLEAVGLPGATAYRKTAAEPGKPAGCRPP